MTQQELEALVQAQYQGIYAYCYRHVNDRELAQDLTQTTFLRFWQSLARYQHKGKLQNYLYTIAGNLCKDWYKRKKPVALADLPPADQDPPAPDDTAARDTALAVRTALDALPFAQRNAVLLHYYHGFTAAEIAAITHAPVPTVRYRLRRAVQTLQKLLQDV